MVLNQSLTDWVPENGSVLIQYVDDLLIGNGMETGCYNDSVHLLDHLAGEGHLASLQEDAVVLASGGILGSGHLGRCQAGIPCQSRGHIGTKQAERQALTAVFPGRNSSIV